MKVTEERWLCLFKTYFEDVILSMPTVGSHQQKQIIAANRSTGNLRSYYTFFWILTTTHCNKNSDREKT